MVILITKLQHIYIKVYQITYEEQVQSDIRSITVDSHVQSTAQSPDVKLRCCLSLRLCLWSLW